MYGLILNLKLLFIYSESILLNVGTNNVLSVIYANA